MFLGIVAGAIVVRHSLVAAIMLAGFFSLLMAAVFFLLDAVDVAFAEAAVGAGITTMLLLATVGLTVQREKRLPRPQWIPLLVTVAVAGLLGYGALDLPPLGDPASPANTHVAPRYIDLAEVETGVPNMVTAVLASYRGYDTLGELVVIFTAGLGVVLLLGLRGAGTGSHAGGQGEMRMTHHVILRVVAKLIIPFILLFALYVQFHGESGPGGGFQAGVLFATALILYALVYGTAAARSVARPRLLFTLMAAGVLLYVVTGLMSLPYGASFLDYGIFASHFTAGQLVGIFLVEFGVGISVAATMIAIYLAIGERRVL